MRLSHHPHLVDGPTSVAFTVTGQDYMEIGQEIRQRLVGLLGHPLPADIIGQCRVRITPEITINTNECEVAVVEWTADVEWMGP